MMVGGADKLRTPNSFIQIPRNAPRDLNELVISPFYFFVVVVFTVDHGE